MGLDIFFMHFLQNTIRTSFLNPDFEVFYLFFFIEKDVQQLKSQGGRERMNQACGTYRIIQYI